MYFTLKGSIFIQFSSLNIIWAKQGHGVLFKIPSIDRNARCRVVVNPQVSNFVINGPKQFTCLPLHVRSMTNCGLQLFKAELDRFLELLPLLQEDFCYLDKPAVPNFNLKLL